MDFNKLKSRYKQFGEFRLVIEYAKLGALWPAIKAGVRCVLKRQSFKQVYPVVLEKVEPFLIQKYGTRIPQKIKANTNVTNRTNKIIWFCWLQGIEQAPDIVHACYNSIKRNIPDREIKLIDANNWKEYVELPDFIVKKWEKGRIPAALFSDLLRLELLIKYGGTWIDSTVLCTGLNDNHNKNDNLSRILETSGTSEQARAGELENKVNQYLDADLFLFQYTKQGCIPVSISNWFITARSNNEVLIVLRDMLYAYWRDYDCTLDYYIFHLFSSMLSKEYPEEIMGMPYGQSLNSLMLLHHWEERFNQKKWDRLTSHVCFHKLAFRVKEKIKNNKENYYNYILSEYGRI